MSFNIKTKTFQNGSGPQAGPSRRNDDPTKFANPRKFFSSQTGNKSTQEQQAESSVACKVLQMQWNEKMRQSQLQPTRNFVPDNRKNHEQKEIKKIPWTNRSGSSGSLDDTNRTIDPWFVDDVWGEDLPPEALEECSKIEMTQALVSEKSRQNATKGSVVALEKEVLAELKDMVWDNWDDSDIAVDNTKVPNVKKVADSAMGTQVLPSTSAATQSIRGQSKEFPSQDWKLSPGQRYLQKSTKSLPSPAVTDSRAKTTEWLRNELQKKNQEVSALKENVSTKNGENKMLREILKSTQKELEKCKTNKQKEEEIVKSQYELREKELKKQLGAFQTHAQFKEKELESYKEKCLEMKKFRTKESNTSNPVDESSFKKFNQSFVRPGEIANRDAVPGINLDQLPVTPVLNPEEGSLICDIFDLERDWDSLKCRLELQSDSNFTQECLLLSQSSLPLRPPVASRYENNGKKLASSVKTIIDGPKPQPEINHFLQPPIEYLSENLLFTEFSELPMENCPFRRPTLIDVWGISYHAFGETRLDEYEKTKIGDPVKPDEARAVLAKKRFFTTLEEERQRLNQLCRTSTWGQESFDCAVKIVECVTEMAREVYASLGDPRYLHASYTINEREPRILKDLSEGSELNEEFDPLSHKPWKDECCVELRRGLVLIGVLCSLDVNITRYVFNPRQRPSGGPGRQHFVMMPNPERMNFAIAETHGNGEIDKTFNRSFSFANDSISEGDEAVFNALPEKLAQLKNREVSESFITSEPSTDSEETRFQFSSIEELERERNLLIDTNNLTSNWERKYLREKMKIVNDKRAIIGETESFEPSIEEIETDNGIQPFLGTTALDPCRLNIHEAFVNNIKKKSTHHVNVLQTTKKKLSCEQIVLLPPGQCISYVEERLLAKSKDHMERTVRVIQTRNEIEVPEHLDFTALFSLDDQDDKDEDLFATQRKKKNEEVLGEIAPTELEGEPTKRLELKRRMAEASLSREDQAGASDEKRTKLEIDRHDSSQLGEKIPATKISLSKKHSLGPLSGRSKNVNDHKMEIDVFDEVEKMYTSEAVGGVEKSSELETSRAPEIEHIPDILGKFKTKINKAGLLELMCEVIKQGGLLRYTHRMIGTMMGQVIMMQYILKHQKMEAQKNMSKIFGILREVMYSRPSPIVVYEVHKLVNLGVTIPGFTRMLCHNSDPDKFVVRESAAYYQRGACLMEMVCILTDMLDEEANWKSAYEMSKWLHYVLTTDRITVTSWYPSGDSHVGRQCSCTVALANCTVIIFYKAALLLRHAVQLDHLTLVEKSQLAEMVVLGIATLSALQELDGRFSKNIYSRRDMFKKFLEHVSYLCNSSLQRGFFNLCETSLKQFKALLANCPLDSQPSQVPGRPDFSTLESSESSLSDVVGLKNLLRRTHIEDD